MTVTQRPSWDQIYLKIAQEFATRSTCLHRQIGAFIVREHVPISGGYNGALEDHPHCLDIGCAREGVPSGQRMELCRGAHAEQNALSFAARFGNPVEGASLYTTHFPCSSCTKSIIPAGIVEVIYGADYPDSLAKKLLDDSGIVVRKVEPAVTECNFCHETTDEFLIVPLKSWFGRTVTCMKCLDGALTWLEDHTKADEYLQDAVDSILRKET